MRAAAIALTTSLVLGSGSFAPANADSETALLVPGYEAARDLPGARELPDPNTDYKVVFADGHLILRAEGGKGTVSLIEATAEGFREKGRFDPPNRSEQASWAHPVVSDGKLWLRDQDVLLCYDLKAK